MGNGNVISERLGLGGFANLIHIFDELVNVLEVLTCILVIEVHTKGHHDVVGGVMFGLVCCRGNKGVHTVLNIVVK